MLIDHLEDMDNETIIGHMRELFQFANDDSEYANGVLFELATESNDPSFIEAVLKYSKMLLSCDALELGRKLKKLRGTETNIYIEVAKSVPKYEEETNEGERRNGYGQYHLRLIFKLFYDDRNIKAENFYFLKEKSDKEIFDHINDYLLNQDEIDKTDIKNEIIRLNHDMSECVKSNNARVENYENNIAHLTKELDGQ